MSTRNKPRSTAPALVASDNSSDKSSVPIGDRMKVCVAFHWYASSDLLSVIQCSTQHLQNLPSYEVILINKDISQIYIIHANRVAWSWALSRSDYRPSFLLLRICTKTWTPEAAGHFKGLWVLLLAFYRYRPRSLSLTLSSCYCVTMHYFLFTLCSWD